MALTSTLLPLALPSSQGQYAASTSDSGGDMSDSQGGSRHRVRTVTLNRRRHCTTYGFSLRGGREHGTGFFISAVEVASEAHAQGLMVGDQIVRINGFPVADATHREVLQLIQGQMTITLKVRSVGMIPVKDYNDVLTWKIVETDSSLLPTSLSSNQSDIICDDHPALQSQNDVRLVLHVAPKAKLGCGICKGPEWRPGIFVQFTKENGLARGAGLRPGDQILQCNNIAFTPDTPFNEAVSVLRSSGLLELVVRKGAGLDLFPGESSGYNSSASSVAGDQSPETWLNKRLSIVKEESIIDSEGRFSHNDVANRNCVERRENQFNSTTPSTSTKSTNTESTRTVIHVGPEESKRESSCQSDTTDGQKNKLAEICMVSQQTETKTTTVLVEVHQSEEEESCKMDNNRLLNSSSTSSFTSSSSNSLSSAISQELQRRSQRRASETSELGRCEKSNGGRNLDLVRSGLDKEKVQQHEQLMEEFKLAHKRMFSNGGASPNSVPSSLADTTSSSSLQERESSQLKEQQQLQQEQPKQLQQQQQPLQQYKQDHKQSTNEEQSQISLGKPQNCTRTFYKEPCPQRNVIQERENARVPNRNRQQNVPPPPPPLPVADQVDSSSLATMKLSNMTINKNGTGAMVSIRPPPSPPACPTPDYDTMSVASEQDVKQPNSNLTRQLVITKNMNGLIGKSKSSIVVNGKSPSAESVEMESLESFKLTNPSTIKPKPPSTYFAQNTKKNANRSSDSSLNSRSSVQNVAIESAKPTITIREYPTTLDRKNPTRFHFLNHNSTSSSILKDQPISSQLHTELSQTLSRANLQPNGDKMEVSSTAAPTTGKSVVTICVNARQNQKSLNSMTTETKGQAPFYLHRPSEDMSTHSKMVSTSVINKPDLSDVDARKSNLRSTSDNSNKNTVTFNFGNNEKPESRTMSIFQPNGILKNGSAGNISQVQIQNFHSGAGNRGPQQKTIKFGGITTIIRNSPEPKM
ncbi:uncharacterized protein LOC142318898 isoform X2 [Lycorma delicatula]|uniref:uncharacterized protein LOC142318898 isoform X2 n=1 Tax=Lycorma delicatula TaxID=130591 RepID=UPI003F518AC5